MRRPNFACIFAVNRMAGITDNTLHVAVCRNNITEIIGYIQLTAGLRAIWPDWGQIASEETSKGKGEIKIARARSREQCMVALLAFILDTFEILWAAMFRKIRLNDSPKPWGLRPNDLKGCWQRLSQFFGNVWLVFWKPVYQNIAFNTGKNNRFPFLDILGYLKNTHKNPKFGRVRHVPTRELGWEFPGWDFSHFAKFGILRGYSFNTLKYPKMGICYFFLRKE